MRPLPRAKALMGREADAVRVPLSTPTPQTQRLGILMLLGSVMLFTMMDALGKHLTARYHPGQVIWMRMAINLAIVLAVLAPRLRTVARSRSPWLQVGRGLTQVASIGLFFTALQYIGLAEATAIMDSNPVLITLAAAVFLGERIGIRRILGIAAALVGALIIIRPGAGVFQPAALLPLLGAFTYAAGAVLTRLAREDSTSTSILWSALFGTVATSLLVPFFWQPIAMQDVWAFVLLGLFGSAAQVMLIKAFAMAEAAAIAPFGYTGLIWAGLWGWLFWGNLPDRWTVIGALIIVGAGLYVWTREARAMHRTKE